jgi:hypothetical protein
MLWALFPEMVITLSSSRFTNKEMNVIAVAYYFLTRKKL